MQKNKLTENFLRSCNLSTNHTFNFLVIIICSIFISCQSTSSNQEHYDYHWTINDSPILIDSCFHVNQGEILKIDAGVQVLLKTSLEDSLNYYSNDFGMLYVEGDIIASGTKDKPIFFTRKSDEGYWGIIYGEGLTEKSRFDFCEFQYGTAVWGIAEDLRLPIISLIESKIAISNCLILHHRGGIYFNNSISSINATELHQISDHYPNRNIVGVQLECVNQSDISIYNSFFYYDYTSIISRDSSVRLVNSTLQITRPVVYIIRSYNSYIDIINSILASTSGSCIDAFNSEVHMSYSIFSGYYNDSFIDEGNNINRTVFISQDHSIEPDFPSINNGTNNVTNLPSKDLRGNPRIVNGTVDIGAVEYQD